ncbi:MAG: hypothetical protein AABX29_09660 [Nanoarchaeota archaeon]
MTQDRLLEIMVREKIISAILPSIIERLHKDYGPLVLIGLLRERRGMAPRNIYYNQQY